MKLLAIAVLAAGMAASQAIAQDKPTAPTAPVVGVPTNQVPEPLDMKKVSYAIGMNWGATLKQHVADADLDSVFSGMKDMLSSNKTRFTEDEAKAVLANFSRVLSARESDKARVAAGKNKAEGEAFLAKNGKEPGVITLPSGLQYKVIAEGSGPSPKSTEVVTVNYRGTLIDGTEFDSSTGPGKKPFIGSVSGGVIKGWTEILQHMKAGSKYKVFIPYTLAYGEAGRRPKIEPFTTLIFDMELVSFTEQQQTVEGVSGDILKVPSQSEMSKGAKIEMIKPGQTNGTPVK